MSDPPCKMTSETSPDTNGPPPKFHGTRDILACRCDSILRLSALRRDLRTYSGHMADGAQIAMTLGAVSAGIAVATFLHRVISGGWTLRRDRRPTAQAECIDAWSELDLDELQGAERHRGARLAELENRDRKGGYKPPRQLSAKVHVRNNSTRAISDVLTEVHLLDAERRPIRVLGEIGGWLASVPSESVAVADSYVQYQGATPRHGLCVLLFTDANGRHWQRDMRTGELTPRENPANPRYDGGAFYGW